MAQSRKRKVVRNKLSMTLTPEKENTANGALDALERALDFLISLTDEERKAQHSLGDKNIVFIQKATELVQKNSNFMPRDFSVEEQLNDTTFYNQITNIERRLNQIMLKVNDTRRQAGSEAYSGALAIYDSARQSNIDDALEPYVDELARNFSRKRSKKEE